MVDQHAKLEGLIAALADARQEVSRCQAEVRAAADRRDQAQNVESRAAGALYHHLEALLSERLAAAAA